MRCPGVCAAKVGFSRRDQYGALKAGKEERRKRKQGEKQTLQDHTRDYKKIPREHSKTENANTNTMHTETGLHTKHPFLLLGSITLLLILGPAPGGARPLRHAERIPCVMPNITSRFAHARRYASRHARRHVSHHAGPTLWLLLFTTTSVLFILINKYTEFITH